MLDITNLTYPGKKVYLLIIPDFVGDILTTTFSSQTAP